MEGVVEGGDVDGGNGIKVSNLLSTKVSRFFVSAKVSRFFSSMNVGRFFHLYERSLLLIFRSEAKVECMEGVVEGGDMDGGDGNRCVSRLFLSFLFLQVL